MSEPRDTCTTLRAEVMRAFAMLCEVPGWAREFNTANATRRAAMYERPLRGIALECIPAGVEHIISTSDYPPTPQKLAAACWKIHRERYPDAPTSTTAYEDDDRKREAVRLEQIQRRMNERAAHLRNAHGITSIREAGEVWALLLRMAQTPEQRQAVLDGAVKMSTLDRAVEEYRKEKAQAERFASRALAATVSAVVEKNAVNL